jgi:hypothetical protein
MTQSPSEPASDLQTLLRDADMNEPLERVAFAEGMLLGVEATRAEQEFHRRRLNRHRYWLEGAGTVAGMGVSLAPESVAAAEAEPGRLGVVTRVIVNAGYGIDGLGRDVLIPERYTVDLDLWLRSMAGSVPGLEQSITAGGLLHLYLMVRNEPIGRNLTPVMARELNAGTDAVAFGRIADGFALEFVPDIDRGSKDTEWASSLGPWRGAFANPLWPLSGAGNSVGLSDAEVVRRRRLLGAYVERLPRPSDPASPSALASRANVPLASLRIQLDMPSGNPALRTNAGRVVINNLVRPFVRTATHALIPDSETDP